MMTEARCRCNAVTCRVDGTPLRCGICHCLDCRRRTGAPFVVFVVFRSSDVIVTGATKQVESRTDRREACAACGSVMLWADDDAQEIELYAGHFPSAGLFAPGYEVWTQRREPWLPPLPIPQYPRDRR
ncbi:GFA family protein [Bacillus sp. NP157]|nr:GFA family protein [Bacillus sp. NP157]